MKALSLLAGVLVLAATALPGTANAQSCMTDGFGFQWTIDLHGPSDIFFGSNDTGETFLWSVTGSRGTNNRTIRHHDFISLNPNADDDPGCGDSGTSVDWFTYNGLVSPAGGGNYNVNGSWYNSCGSSGTFTATITPGACRIQAPPAPTPGSPAVAVSNEQ
jgi:hypothetical protein